jgi:preprotein translocase subunit SecF
VSWLGKIDRGEADIDFRRWWKRGFILSGVVILASLVSLATQGLNLGIDFEGGTSWEAPAPGVSVPEARDALRTLGEEQAKIQIVGADTLRVQARAEDPETQEAVRQVLADLGGVDAGEVSVSTVGPSWGEEITRSAVRALVIFLVVITVYLSIRLEWEMAAGAITALLHDILVSVGIYSIFRFEVTPATVIAFLTILGYSIYDTIVVYDKVKQNEGRVGLAGRMTYTEMLSLSMNQVLVRSLNTTITSLLPVVSLLVVGSWILGAVTIQEFGIALFVGLLSGAYSSIFIAGPTVAFLKERQGKYRQIRTRLEQSRAQGGGIPVATAGPATAGPAAPADGDRTSAGDTATPSGAARPVPAPQGAIPPRPRKKGKRR